LKIDMMKAYDTMEWAYLCGVLQKLGFHDSWISNLLLCGVFPRCATATP
jgi:hypothetical protein